MLIALPPFDFYIDTTTFAGASLWSLALYLGFSSTGEWVAEQLNRWFNFVAQSLSASEQEFNRTRSRKESQNALYASLFSIVPFLALGLLCNYAVEIGLGRSWAISVGIIACIGCGVYELGRRSGQASRG